MNKDNFKLLIEAIEKDGKFRFNMGVFIGKLDASESTIERFRLQNFSVNTLPTNSLTEIETTKMFNCDSVGCIAGFATALANNWETPNFLKSNADYLVNPSQMSYNHADHFEYIANNFLGLTKSEGENLYYCNEGNSVWKMVRWHEPYRYGDLEYDCDESDVEECQADGIKWNTTDHIEINLQSISPEIAIDVLTRIMNEEIGLADGNYNPYYQKEIDYTELSLGSNIQVNDMVKAMINSEPCLFNNSSDNLMVNSKDEEIV